MPDVRPARSTRVTIEDVFRSEYPRLVGALARMSSDLGVAEELAQDAMVAALEQWPVTGVPANPGAWLTTIGKRRAVDLFRRNSREHRKFALISRESDPKAEAVTEDPDAALDHDLGDNLLRLMFTACHPVLGLSARVALTLKVVGGLTTDEIARAFLVPESTVAQRIVRAKKALSTAAVPFEVPRGADFLERLPSVLQVVYLIYNEGYSATSSDDWMRPDLCDDALRLGRTLAGLLPSEPDVLGLVALMEIQSSRQSARVGLAGEPVLLLDQNRADWDRSAITRGLDALSRAEGLAPVRGPYLLQAAIAAAHARAATAEDTDWRHMADLYTELAVLVGSPVVELNRAVALGMAYGPLAGLELVDQLVDDSALPRYHLLNSVRGDLLYKLGRFEEARAEFERAAQLTRNAREREMSLARARACVAAEPR
ncbi:RNA polymerase sigma factor, sigma-70 family [Nakamurella panacisegetis]|uniref:RNA polymerase sigma factor n=1 Tax=Nakamurella panacisegetis TaxID=1090615 RepID=A0A1H0L2A0_9ACTN|nr:RNA polymerase sigma factor [Nakamurella panacisegetis]SDO62143.1 RNA polymerase sigma factor, sigma-70 family [Nakamurella panacisegetis]